MKKTYTSLLYTIYFLCAIAPTTLSAQLIDRDRTGDCNFKTGEINMECIPTFIGEIIQMLFGFLGAVFFIMALWGAYEYALSGIAGTGEEGKKKIRNAILGFLICVSSFFILNFILSDAFGI